MTRTSLLAATAFAALATATLLTTDADARTRSGFAGHYSHSARHSVSHASRSARHFGPGTRTAHRNAGSHQAAHRNSGHPNFGQRRQNQNHLTQQAHQNPTNRTNVSHPNVSLNQSHSNTNAGQLRGVVRGTSTQASNQAHQGAAQMHLAQAHNVKNAQNAANAAHNTHQAHVQPSQTQIQQVQKIAAADQKAGAADLKQAAQLKKEAAVLQAKAAKEPNKSIAAREDAQAKRETQAAAKLNTQGQAQLKNAKAENAVVAALKNKSNGNNGNNGNNSNSPNGNNGNNNNNNGGAGANNGGGGNANNGGGGNANNGGGGNANNGGGANANNAGTSPAPGGTRTSPNTPAQVAAAAPTVVAPIAQNPAPQSAPGSFKALALAWNQSGGWVVRFADALPAANEDAVTSCNGQFGECQQAATVDNVAFGCLAIMSNADHQLFSATGLTLEEVTNSLQQQLQSRGEQGELVYSGCNNG